MFRIVMGFAVLMAAATVSGRPVAQDNPTQPHEREERDNGPIPFRRLRLNRRPLKPDFGRSWIRPWWTWKRTRTQIRTRPLRTSTVSTSIDTTIMSSTSAPATSLPTPAPTSSPVSSEPTPSPTTLPSTLHPTSDPSPAPSPQPTPSPTPGPTSGETSPPTAAPTVELAGDCSDMVVYDSLACAGDPMTTCVELLGPVYENAESSLPIVVAAPHGGSEKPAAYADRDCVGNPDWVCLADSYTLNVAESITTSLGNANGGKCPWVVISHLHRSKLDPNREVGEAADGDANAVAAYNEFHAFITAAQIKVYNLHGDDGDGIKGMLLDLHGYSGTAWNASGAGYTQYGYRLLESTLEQDPLPDSPSGSLTHASQRYGTGGLEYYVRGNGSMGALVPQIDNLLLVGDLPENCGEPMPSPDIPSPQELCDDLGLATCDYKSGGYDLSSHENNIIAGLKMNAVQIELPRCIRRADHWYSGVTSSDTDAIRTDFADKLASGMCSWLEGVFDETLC